MAKLGVPAVPAEDLGSVLNIHMRGLTYKHLQLKFQKMLQPHQGFVGILMYVAYTHKARRTYIPVK